MTGSSPISVQAKGEPAAIVPATIQTPKAIIPTEIRYETTVSMASGKSPFFANLTDGWSLDGVEFNPDWQNRIRTGPISYPWPSVSRQGGGTEGG